MRNLCTAMKNSPCLLQLETAHAKVMKTQSRHKKKWHLPDPCRAAGHWLHGTLAFSQPSWGFPDISVGEESACDAGDPVSIPGLGRCPGERNGYPFSILGLPLWLSWWRIHPQCGRPGWDPWVGKIPWRREWLSAHSILAWSFPQTIVHGSQTVRHDWATFTFG